jgi:hypothetical protein
MEKTTIVSSVESTTNTAVVIGNFGNGRYSSVMAELYRDTQRLLGFSKEQAHITAARLGVDLGRLSSGEAKVSFGKSVTKDGFRTIKEVCSVKMPESWAISIAVVCNGLDTLRKQGLVTIENSIADTLLEAVNTAATRLPV